MFGKLLRGASQLAIRTWERAFPKAASTAEHAAEGAARGAANTAERAAEKPRYRSNGRDPARPANEAAHRQASTHRRETPETDTARRSQAGTPHDHPPTSSQRSFQVEQAEARVRTNISAAISEKGVPLTREQIAETRNALAVTRQLTLSQERTVLANGRLLDNSTLGTHIENGGKITAGDFAALIEGPQLAKIAKGPTMMTIPKTDIKFAIPRWLKIGAIGLAGFQVGFVDISPFNGKQDGGLLGNALTAAGTAGIPLPFLTQTKYYQDGVRAYQESSRDKIKTAAEITQQESAQLEANRGKEAQEGFSSLQNSIAGGNQTAPSQTASPTPELTETFNFMGFARNLKTLGFQDNEIDSIVSSYNQAAEGGFDPSNPADVRIMRESTNSLSAEKRNVVLESLGIN